MGKIVTWLLSGALAPLIKGGLDAYKLRLEGQNSHEAKVVELAQREMELDALEMRLNADRKRDILGKWSAPENLFAYFIAFPYWFVVITLDFLVFPALGIEHVTQPLKGETAVVMGMIMAFWFGKRTITTVADSIGRIFAKR